MLMTLKQSSKRDCFQVFLFSRIVFLFRLLLLFRSSHRLAEEKKCTQAVSISGCEISSFSNDHSRQFCGFISILCVSFRFFSISTFSCTATIESGFTVFEESCFLRLHFSHSHSHFSF